MKPNITSALLALAAATLLTQQAQAQNSYTTGDLLLGFSQNGNASDYVVNVGLASTVINAAPANGPITVADLSTTELASFDSTAGNWATDPTLQWGIAGGTLSGTSTSATGTFGLPESTVFLTEEAGAAALTVNSYSAQNGWDGQIDGTLGGGFNNSTQAPSGVAATLQSASAGNSWDTLALTESGAAFGSGDSIVSTLSPTSSVLDLYELDPSNARGTKPAATLLGAFSLESNGDLVFTPLGAAAAPEPSSYALIAVGLTLLFWHLRRKAAQA